MAGRPHLFVVPSGASAGSEGKWTSAGGVVFDRKGRVALVLERKRSELRWTLPKGRLEPGETLEEAALREVHEEAGVRAQIVGYVGAHDGRRSQVHYFRMRVQRVEDRLDLRVEEVRFVLPARALQLVDSARDRRILRAAAQPQRQRMRLASPSSWPR